MISHRSAWMRGGWSAAVCFSLLLPFGEGNAQTCPTSNCSQTTPPPGCRNRATPRTLEVLMTGTGFPTDFLFVPADPKIEPGECIAWKPDTVTHSSTHNLCAPTCENPPCKWETGDASLGEPSVFCFYDASAFPATTSDGYYCRIHATPEAGTMRGTLKVTSPIDLRASRSGNDVRLAWTGGAFPGDLAAYKVLRSASDPAFAAFAVLDPDGGSGGTSFTDAGGALGPGARFYLVRNKQQNEP